MSDTATMFEAPVLKTDLRVRATAGGEALVDGVGPYAVDFLMAVQADDLARVREYWAKAPETMKPYELGQEIASRVAHVARQMVKAGLLVYSAEEGLWVLDALKVRNTLFGMPGR